MSQDQGFQKLYTLGQDSVDMLADRLANGVGYAELCDLVQKEWGCFQDIKRNSVRKMLSRFYNQQVKGQEQQRILEKTQNRSVKKLREHKNALERLRWLADVQQTRFERSMAHEEEQGMLFESTMKEAKALHGILIPAAPEADSLWVGDSPR